jgi:serine/threonine-protein kinase HipA
MRRANVYMHGMPAGVLEEIEYNTHYRFVYKQDYDGEPVSLTMPIEKKEFEFNTFPPFFDGLLPEGVMLEGLLRQKKIDKNDYFSQLITVGSDLVGAVTVEEIV